MLTFFNENLLQELSCNDPNYYLALLHFHVNGIKYPKTRNDKYKPSTKSLVGLSYLLNPKQLLSDKTVDIYHKIQYVKLASRRDYLLYKFYKDPTIDISFYPDINLNVAKQNPLLKVTSQKIHFKYEK